MSTQIVPVALQKGAAEIPTRIEVADAHIVSKVGASKPKALIPTILCPLPRLAHGRMDQFSSR